MKYYQNFKEIYFSESSKHLEKLIILAENKYEYRKIYQILR